MSNILSASSRTKYVTRFKFVTLVSIKSTRRPGVATKISVPFSNYYSYRGRGAPPNTAQTLLLSQYFLHSTTIYEASSLVGTSTRTIGPSPLFKESN